MFVAGSISTLWMGLLGLVKSCFTVPTINPSGIFSVGSVKTVSSRFGVFWSVMFVI